VEAGSTEPRLVAKVTGVPSGMWPVPEVSWPAELWVRSAVTIWPSAEIPSTSQGVKSMDPAIGSEIAPQPGLPGPALQPNQLFSASRTCDEVLALAMAALELSTMRLKLTCSWAAPVVSVRKIPLNELRTELDRMSTVPAKPGLQHVRVMPASWKLSAVSETAPV